MPKIMNNTAIRELKKKIEAKVSLQKIIKKINFWYLKIKNKVFYIKYQDCTAEQTGKLVYIYISVAGLNN